MKYFGLIAIIFFFQVNLNAQWFYQNPLPTGDHLIDVAFSSESIGYAIGSYSCIIKTIDAGNSWHVIKEYEENTWLKSLYFINDSIGYICGIGVFAKTMDAGNTWENLEGLEGEYTNVYFLNENIGFMTSLEGEILKTNDGGTTWVTQQIGYPLELNSIDFINSDTAFCVGSLIVGTDEYEGIIYQTVNCGEEWFEINTNNAIEGKLSEIKFINDSSGIALNNSRIVYTINKGLTWDTKELSNDIYLKSLCYLAPNHSLIVGWQDNNCILLESTSFFESWSQSELSEYTINSICPIANEGLCAVGNNGTILKSENTGVDWSEMSKNVAGASSWQTFISVDFSDISLGMVVGEKGRIIKTTNSGNDWNLMENSLVNVFFTSSHFINTDTIIATSYQGIFRSTDGGISWSSTNNYQTKEMFFLNNMVGYAVGENILYKTQNGGQDWIVHKEFAYGENVSEIRFMGQQTGYILGTNEIFKSNDNGNTWVKINMINDDPLISFDFLSEDTGFVVDNARYLYKTTDGGNSWNKYDLGLYGSNSIKFTHNNGIIVGTNYILKTADGGNVWMKLSNITHNTLHSVELMPNGSAYAVGRGFTIIKTDNYGGVGDTIDVSLITAFTDVEKYDQISVFPNPTLDKIVIQFNNPDQKIDYIRLINIEGKTIKYLEMNSKTTTNQTITLDLTEEKDGLYFCIISLNKKIIISKTIKTKYL